MTRSVHGPGGSKNNKKMSLGQFSYATKGIAHETGRPHREVVEMIMEAQPRISGTGETVADLYAEELARRAEGEEQWLRLREPCSPLVRHGVLATYSSALSRRDAEQAAQSAACLKGPLHRQKKASLTFTPEWGAYSSPHEAGSPYERGPVARRMVYERLRMSMPPAATHTPLTRFASLQFGRG